MIKKLSALMALVMATLVLLTGCVAGSPNVDEANIERPAVVVTAGDITLDPTVAVEETAEPSPTVSPEATDDAAPSETPQEEEEPKMLNPLPAGATLTLSGTHSGGITSICYRFDGGETTTIKESSTDVTVPDAAQKLELYVIGGNGIASQWATYYLTNE